MVGIRTNNYYFPRRRLARNPIMKQFLFLFLFTAGLTAQLKNPVSVRTGTVPGTRAGEVIHIPVIASMDPEWFIYSIYKTSDGPIPTAINVSGKAVAMGGWSGSQNQNINGMKVLKPIPIITPVVQSLLLLLD